ncbi:hypothetical protein [Gluconacetobacter diazotrophicus]|uniref:Uncharacterized protein n=1 Tax=Gluconacetobacter diazotrophicus (strain ATCC 49037 / DSM 5601 / CCUG 37298 / CIP 103539 / LMG 7603 / PAl5) TaxID=272568 RepID=A9H6Q2_GLUDA|nr:hypothetical protein [Gluconacetobacter diazotrophicus]CAP57531.1 hypothetical protein GDI3588 [Gluconacetobacter diazotrophicus PA1 5]
MTENVPRELKALLRENFLATSHPRKSSTKSIRSKMHLDRIYPTGGNEIFIEFSNGPDKHRGNSIIICLSEKFISSETAIIDFHKNKNIT